MKESAQSLPVKDKFNLPEGVIYLDGNALGPLPKGGDDRISSMIADEWGNHLITGWNRDGWMAQPERAGNMAGCLIGAPETRVMMGDTLSVKVYQALCAALKMRPDRRVILSDSGNFPSDLYMAQGLIQQLDNGFELRVVAPEKVAATMDPDIAVSMITQVDYRTGRMRVGTPPVLQMTALEHALSVWDGVDMQDLRNTSMRLSDLFIAEVEARCPALALASPRNVAERGSQVSFTFKEGYAAMQALMARGVIGDFRAPNVMRFGFTPLYIDEGDVLAAVDVLEDVIKNGLWDTPDHKTKSWVT